MCRSRGNALQSIRPVCRALFRSHNHNFEINFDGHAIFRLVGHSTVSNCLAVSIELLLLFFSSLFFLSFRLDRVQDANMEIFDCNFVNLLLHNLCGD